MAKYTSAAMLHLEKMKSIGGTDLELKDMVEQSKNAKTPQEQASREAEIRSYLAVHYSQALRPENMQQASEKFGPEASRNVHMHNIERNMQRALERRGQLNTPEGKAALTIGGFIGNDEDLHKKFGDYQAGKISIEELHAAFQEKGHKYGNFSKDQLQSLATTLLSDDGVSNMVAIWDENTAPQAYGRPMDSKAARDKKMMRFSKNGKECQSGKVTHLVQWTVS